MDKFNCYSGVVFTFTDELARIIATQIKKEFDENGESKTFNALHLENESSLEQFFILYEEYGVDNDIFDELRNYSSLSKLWADEDDAVLYRLQENGSIKWFESDVLEFNLYFYNVPSTNSEDFNVLKPLFNSLDEIVEAVRLEFPFIPKDYDIKKNLYWMDWHEGCY